MHIIRGAGSAGNWGVPPDFWFLVSEGNQGYSVIHNYGRNPDADNGVEEGVSQQGNFFMPAVASPVRIKAGGNVGDTASGAGAREIIIFGSDQNGSAISESIITNGPDASAPTSASFLRVYRAFVLGHGTYATVGTAGSAANFGDIVIEDSDGGNDFITIAQHEGQTEYAGYHIPSNKIGYLSSIHATVSSNKEADVLIYIRPGATNASSPLSRRLEMHIDGVVGEVDYTARTPRLLGSDTDVWFNCISTANGTEVSVDFEIILVDNG